MKERAPPLTRSGTFIPRLSLGSSRGSEVDVEERRVQQLVRQDKRKNQLKKWLLWEQEQKVLQKLSINHQKEAQIQKNSVSRGGSRQFGQDMGEEQREQRDRVKRMSQKRKPQRYPQSARQLQPVKMSTSRGSLSARSAGSLAARDPRLVGRAGGQKRKKEVASERAREPRKLAGVFAPSGFQIRQHLTYSKSTK